MVPGKRLTITLVIGENGLIMFGLYDLTDYKIHDEVILLSISMLLLIVNSKCFFSVFYLHDHSPRS